LLFSIEWTLFNCGLIGLLFLEPIPMKLLHFQNWNFKVTSFKPYRPTRCAFC
jgi:hypothetical protein